ncbi:MAG: LPS export ABC transporter periplasmic protein LptC [Thermodesulfobacteriota bacterium]
MDKLKILLVSALLGLSLTSVVIFFKSRPVERPNLDVAEPLPDNADMQLKGINFTEVDPSGREWNMEARTLHYFRAKDLVVLDRVKATFHGLDGPMTVTGDKGYYEKTAKKVRLVGRVMGKDTRGRSLTAEEVIYDLGTGWLTVPGYFEIRSPRLDLDGHGLSVNTRDNQIQVAQRANLLVKSTKGAL